MVRPPRDCPSFASPRFGAGLVLLLAFRAAQVSPAAGIGPAEEPLPRGAIARLVNKKPAEVRGIAFSPDGRLLACCSPGDADKGIRLWDVKSAKVVRVLAEPTGRAWSPAFAPDGKVLAATGGDKVLILWDVDAGKTTVQKGNPSRRSGLGWMNSVVFSPDGKSVACLSRDSGRFGEVWAVHFWETLTTDERVQIGLADRGSVITCFAFSPDGRLLAIGTHAGEVRLWKLAEERFIRTLRFDGSVNTVAFSPDSGQLFALGYADEDARGNSRVPLRSWDVASGKPLLRLTGEDPNKRCLAISPNGRLVAIARGPRLLLLDSTTAEKRGEFTARAPLGINALAFSPDGKLLATADTEILLWDLSSLPSAKAAERTKKPSSARPGTEADTKNWPREEVERGWSDLGSGDAAQAFRAMCALARHPRQSLPLLRERLHPVLVPKPERIAELLDDLDSDTFVVRNKATKELVKLAETVEPALRRALADKPSLEKRRRIEQLLGAPHHPPAEQMRVLRAIEVLEQVGTPDARRILERLAEGTAGALRTEEARASLARLKRRLAAR